MTATPRAVELIEIAATAFEEIGQLGCDDRVDTAHVGTHRIEFAERAQDIVTLATLGIHGVPNDHLAGALTVAIDTTVALLHHVRVVGNFEMDHQVAVVLEIDALRCGVGRQ